jgi:hydrogenase expression/formation protein HypE
MNRVFGRRLDVEKGKVDMSHGAGGKAMAQLIEELFAAELDNDLLRERNDHALLPELGAGRVAMTTDGFVVSPLFFPGGDIGSLAIHGTVNDLAMAGAVPRYLTSGFILEEGLPLSDLRRIVSSMARAAREAGVLVVTGDTKVVERGKGDGVFIHTTGVGVVPEGVTAPGGARARPGDRVLVSGTIGDHGVAILSKRQGIAFETDIVSDSQPLHDLVAAMLAVVPDVHVLRDPTRGGVAATLNEIAQQSGVGMQLVEDAVPVKGPVAAACELLGIDPLHVANEGKLLAICAPHDADALLEAMRAHPRGADAAIIGTITEDPERFVQLETAFGGTRVLDWASGEPLPRIC